MDTNVYLGVWTNWSRGLILGLTLTTTKYYGNLIIAFTASFIGYVATRFWRIACFAFHNFYSTSDPRTAIHQQRQVILRNSTSAESGILSLLCVLWAWKRCKWDRLLGLLPPLLLAGVSLVAFTAAGGFSSSISTTTGDEVLLKGPSCGLIGQSRNRSTDDLWYIRTSNMLNNAENYAQQCYNSTGSSGMLECNKFVVDRLPTTLVNDSAECPFENKMCRNLQSNIRLDTGYLDSNDHLGSNAPANRRFAWRYVLTCAPIVTEGYTSQIVDNNTTWVKYHYGDGLVGSSDNLTTNDYIYIVPGVESQSVKPPGLNLRASKNYALATIAIPTERGTTKWNNSLIPELQRADGDVTLIFLSGNGVVNSQIMDDDWYRATVPRGPSDHLDATGTVTAYGMSDPASPMGCVEQWQWCNMAYPKDQGCGPLASFSDALLGAAPFFNLTRDEMKKGKPNSNEPDKSRFMWSYKIMSFHPTYLDKPLQFLGAKSLLSQNRLFAGVQSPLPSNQWHLDVGHWFDIVLAATQAAFVNTATLSYESEYEPYTVRPVNEEQENICNSQKIRSTAYVSFNLFGLYITLGVGMSIVAISYVLGPFQALLHKRRKIKPYPYLEWTANSALQLHRLAHEEPADRKTWSRCTERVPVTDDLETILGHVDIEDLTHPVLTRAPSWHIGQPCHCGNEKQGSSSFSTSLARVSLTEDTALDPGDEVKTLNERPTTNEDVTESHLEGGILPVD